MIINTISKNSKPLTAVLSLEIASYAIWIFFAELRPFSVDTSKVTS